MVRHVKLGRDRPYLFTYEQVEKIAASAFWRGVIIGSGVALLAHITAATVVMLVR